MQIWNDTRWWDQNQTSEIEPDFDIASHCVFKRSKYRLVAWQASTQRASSLAVILDKPMQLRAACAKCENISGSWWNMPQRLQHHGATCCQLVAFDRVPSSSLKWGTDGRSPCIFIFSSSEETNWIVDVTMTESFLGGWVGQCGRRGQFWLKSHLFAFPTLFFPTHQDRWQRVCAPNRLDRWT